MADLSSENLGCPVLVVHPVDCRWLMVGPIRRRPRSCSTATVFSVRDRLLLSLALCLLALDYDAGLHPAFSDMDSDACLPIGRNRGMDTPKDRFTGVPVAGIAGVRGVGLDGPWPSISTCDLSSLRLLSAGSSSYTLTLNPPSISFAQESPRFLVSFFLI